MDFVPYRNEIIISGPQWISVKDRLPTSEGNYLALWTGRGDGRTFASQCLYHKSIGFSPERDVPVTHWMPLPGGPKQ